MTILILDKDKMAKYNSLQIGKDVDKVPSGKYNEDYEKISLMLEKLMKSGDTNPYVKTFGGRLNNN